MDSWSDGTELRERKGKAGRMLYEDGGGKGWGERVMCGSKPRENTGRPDRHDDKRQILDDIRKNTPDWPLCLIFQTTAHIADYFVSKIYVV